MYHFTLEYRGLQVDIRTSDNGVIAMEVNNTDEGGPAYLDRGDAQMIADALRGALDCLED